MDIQHKHKKLEIGTTWLHPDHWGTVINFECKLLLLTYAFETLRALRVQFKTDENNIRSRKAIEKVGGRFEGILRNDMLRDNGTRRNSAYFSIIEEEWSGVKKMLESAVAQRS
jgi:RimJ/RimL family protein N-acetyltransferase